jgi:PLP dependent protein
MKVTLKETIVNPFDPETDNSELQKALRQNLEQVRSGVARALEKSASPQREITIVAASKKQPLEKIRILAGMGQLHFGENYVQEALSRIEILGDQGITWHFIGGLQTNKARHAAGKFALIHSVDSLKLARELNKRASGLDMVQPVLIQVNLAGESQKFGIPEKDLHDLSRAVLELDNLKLEGLMTMPPFFDDPEKSRPFFAGLQRLRQGLEKNLGVNLPHLSMGMSGDYEAAVEEGATIIRVGTCLFGPR